ncbi:hypothetical protein BDA99DRAFT_610078 [Phascolomyces articulosus]|uniref:Beta-glucuronidase C-terminal domain-containing protein n=1 Tax=Phascolomyces articulosus TaxID=60185 RepID=A0AAD5P7E1_9FUNG|nr:hypothetical protein BDA99DRAFT_610078 [Phascolomyces articulosus]
MLHQYRHYYLTRLWSMFVILFLSWIIQSINGQEETTQQTDNNNNEQLNSFVVQLPSTASGIQIPSYSHGFSLEMSHWTNVFGTRTTDKQSTGFLQLLGNIQDRRGSLMIRLGGNSQDAAFSDESINSPIAKTGEQATRTNSGAMTFNIKVHSQMFDAMRQISRLVPVQWTFGLNFEDANNMESALSLGKLALEKLGGHEDGDPQESVLYAIQIGNEPDLYAKHGLRSEAWGVEDYTKEWMSWATQLSQHYFNNGNDNKIRMTKRRNIFTGGVICCTWHLQDLLDSGYFESTKDLINSITVQKYSSNACFGVAKGDLSDYTSHAWITEKARKMYEEPAQVIIANGKELIMGETNSAACRGIKGISDTYASSLWWVDWQLFLYSIGFSSIELQLGGSTAHYNPMSKVGGSWVANPIYYGSLVTAEALGSSDATPQVMHIDVSSASDMHAAYAIFHQQKLRYMVLINFDPDNEAVFPLQNAENGWWNNDDGGELKIKRLTATSLHEKHAIRWAGQTLRGVSDGVLRDDIQIEQVMCNDPNRCEINLPKASVALVGRYFDEYHGTPIVNKPYDVDGLVGNNSDQDSSNPLHLSSSNSGSSTSIMTGYIILLPPVITYLILFVSLLNNIVLHLIIM